MNEVDIKKYINRFTSCQYMKNFKIKKDETHEISIIGYFIDMLDIDTSPRLKGWIEKNLVACWGNKKVKCLGRSDKIFEVLNLIMEKLKGF